MYKNFVFLPPACNRYRIKIGTPMNVIQETVGEVLVVGPEGKLDGTSAGDLEEVLQSAIDKGSMEILIDCSSLAYISSSGLRVILKAAKRLNKANGKVALCRLSDNVEQVFQISGFSTVLDIDSTREAALAAFFPAGQET